MSCNTAFLLDCCRLETAKETGLRDGGGNLEPAQLAEAAQQQGIIPLVARRVAQLGTPLHEHPAIRRILRSADAIVLRNHYLVEQLVILLNRFDRAGINALVIKGPVLAMLAYREGGLRSFGDLDVVIHPRDLPKAERVLSDLGFSSSLYDRKAVQSGFFDAIEANFQRSEDKVNLDLHWDLMPRSFALGPSGEAIWRRAIEIDLAETKVRTLSHEDHLLYLTVHSARHGWEFLSQVCDVAYLLERQSIDCTAVLKRAEETHCARAFAVALLLANELIGTPLPLEARSLADKDGRARRLARQIGEDLMAGRAAGSIAGSLRKLSLMDRQVDRLRHILSGSLAPTLIDRRFAKLPRWLYPAYFLLRPIRIGFVIARKRR